MRHIWNHRFIVFNGNKIITHPGGAIVTKTKELKDRAIFLPQSRDDAPYYQHSEIGYNYRMSNICAGIGRSDGSIDSHVELRRTRNAWYQDF
jgi:dTDP-4-amino-4,6-dideoxygalactose transaminase